MKVSHLVVSTLAVAIFLAGSAAAETPHIFKHDQFPEDLVSAANQISGTPLAVHPGFVASEAFGVVFHPDANMYPVKLTAVDIVVASPPGGDQGSAPADIEVWFHDGTSPDPGKSVADFVLDTSDVIDPVSGQMGMHLKGNTALSYEFNWDDMEGHPPELYEGSFSVVIRFKDQAQDLQAAWGSLQCMSAPDLGMCGCQKVAPLTDQATTGSGNLLHIIYPPGNCNGQAGKWLYTEQVGVTGDFILRVRASVAGGGGCDPDCGGKECGGDGCGGDCGVCFGSDVCVNGVCKDPGGCEPKCDGKECGDDSCGGACGLCGAGEVCVAGQCEEDGPCQPKCEGKDCGDDSCGGVCGLCGNDEACVAGECQSAVCDPDCDGKVCGDDGCDGSCGDCAAGEICEAGACKEDPGGGTGDLTVTAISPTSGYNDGDTPVTVLGTGFEAGATVKLGGTALSAVTVDGPGLISATVPAGMDPGFYMLVVLNAAGDTANLMNAYEVKEKEVETDEPLTSGNSGCHTGAGSSSALALALLLLGLAMAIRFRRGRV